MTRNKTVDSTRYLHHDIMGTPVSESGDDMDYSPSEHRLGYGLHDGLGSYEALATKVGYTGHMYDIDTGLNYANARYYKKDASIFISPDPIPFRENDLTSINRYVYGANNPYRYTDPTGKEVIVYVWGQEGTFGTEDFLWGHAYLEIRNNPDIPDTYISLWPNRKDSRGLLSENKYEPNIYTAYAIEDRIYEQDKNAERSSPDHIISLQGLDEKAIYDWWGEKWKSHDATWSSFSNNCSTNVARALHVENRKPRVTLKAPLLALYDSVSRRVIWTPSDVAVFANYLKNEGY